MIKNKLFLFVEMSVLFVVFASASTARAQITFDASGSGTGTSAPTISWSHTVGNGNNRILVVSVATNGDRAASSVTYAGQLLTRQALNNEYYPTVEIWTLVAPPTGTAQVVVTHSVTELRIIGGSVSFSGVNQATPVRGSSTARQEFGVTGTISTSVTTNPGDLVVDMAAVISSNGSTSSPAAGQTQRWSNTLDPTIGAGSTKPGVSSSTTVSWDVEIQSASGGFVAQCAVSLIPAPSLTPDEMIDNLTETVQSYNVQRGTENALLAKLYNALERLSESNVPAARGSLEAFINHVNALRGVTLTNVQADELITAANNILVALG